MSEKEQEKAAASAEEKKDGKEELSEEQLETVAGGILIGLNQPIKQLSTGDTQTVKLNPDVSMTDVIKFLPT